MIRQQGPPKELRGNLLSGSVSEKIDQIERKLILMNRRTASYVIGIAPRIPISEYIEAPEADTGIILRKILPSNGIITAGYLFIEQLDKKESPQVTISLDNQMGGSSIKIPVDKATISVHPNISVIAGQRLTLSISPVESCKNIWIGFIFEMSDEGLAKENHLVDKFLSMIGQVDKELENA